MAEFTSTITTVVNCPDCASAAVIKHGKQSGQQRYRCKGCRKAFRYNGKATGRQVDAEQMGAAIRMFYMGMSYKQIAETMKRVFDIPEPSKQTIYAWVKEYTDKAVQESRAPQYRAHTGSVWVADEMMVDVGGQKVWQCNGRQDPLCAGLLFEQGKDGEGGYRGYAPGQFGGGQRAEGYQDRQVAVL